MATQRSSFARLVSALPLLLVVPSACSTTKITLKTVRTQAARDLGCDEDGVSVVRLNEAKKLYQASGCGHRQSYVCDGWNAYDQTPVCHEAAE